MSSPALLILLVPLMLTAALVATVLLGAAVAAGAAVAGPRPARPGPVPVSSPRAEAAGTPRARAA